MIFYLCYHKYKNNSLFINLNINMEIKKLKRPQTPHVEIGNGTGIVNSKNQKDNIFKNFSNSVPYSFIPTSFTLAIIIWQLSRSSFLWLK